MVSPMIRVYRSVAIACIAPFLFGFDTGSIGGILEQTSFQAEFGHFGETLHGVIVATILVPSVISGVFAGAVADKLSRTRTICLGSAIFAAGSAICAGSVKSIGMLIGGRIIAGFGEGLFLGTAAVYCSEISPKKRRGMMMTILQLFIATGVCAGYWTCYGATNISNSLQWRLPFVLSTALAITVAVLSLVYLPHSPRWLLLNGRRADADKVLDLIVGRDVDALNERKEMLIVPVAMTGSKRQAFLRMWQKDVRWRSILGASIQALQMMSGIDFVLFYATTLFRQAGLTGGSASFLGGGVTGIFVLVGTIATIFYVDRLGRRTIFVAGGACVATSLLVIGSLYAADKVNTTEGGKWAVIVMIEFFAFSFAASWGVVTRLYASEIQPSRTRAAAASISVAINQLINTVVALTGPQFLATSASGPYFTYGAVTVFTTFAAYWFMPETKGHSLEAIDDMFNEHFVPLAAPLPFSDASKALVGKYRDARERRMSRRESETIPDGQDDEKAAADPREAFRREMRAAKLLAPNREHEVIEE
ncbi:sugar porter family MFS transporter [Rhodotorula paludigena]|uniref:sugar porter family MFS transporter n=1 Tax=Rhodotorula paludigena TaxID=86838 RepID=UPI0031737711